MNKLLISAGAVAALALTSAPAAATPVTASANAKAKIYKPLKIQNNTGLDFATIVLSGSGSYNATVSVDQTGAITCDPNVTCSGTPAAASFTAFGTSNANLAITLPSSTVTLLGTNSKSNTLTLTLNAPTTENLGSAGPTTGVTFGVGGSITFPSTQADDTYTGTFSVNADYQ
jgi:Mat/Ecp fimbriae major subunit